MSLSRAQIEAMDRDELIETILGFNERLADTQTVVFERMKPTLDRLESRVEELEAENQRLRERLDDTTHHSKEAKAAAIVRYADNKRSSRAPAVKLTPAEVKGATGCSRRYAYDLLDDLPAEYDWFLTPAEMTQYGSLEIDNTEERRLGIDFEGVHSSGCPVNKFTTGREGADQK